MRLWARVRRVQVVLVALGVQAAILASVPPGQVLAPTLTGGTSTGLPWPALLCLVPALTVARVLDGRGTWAERRSRRPVVVADAGLVLGTAIVGGLIGLFLVDDPDLARLAARNGLVLTLGVAAAAVHLGSARAAALAIGGVVLAQSYGPRAPASGVVRIFQQQADPWLAWMLAVALVVLWPISLCLGHRRAR